MFESRLSCTFDYNVCVVVNFVYIHLFLQYTYKLEILNGNANLSSKSFYLFPTIKKKTTTTAYAQKLIDN